MAEPHVLTGCGFPGTLPEQWAGSHVGSSLLSGRLGGEGLSGGRPRWKGHWPFRGSAHGTPAPGVQALPREHRGRGGARWQDHLVPCFPLTHPHRSVKAQRGSACFQKQPTKKYINFSCSQGYRQFPWLPLQAARTGVRRWGSP